MRTSHKSMWLVIVALVSLAAVSASAAEPPEEPSLIGSVLLGDVVGDRFGTEVALSADGFTIAVGASQSDVNGDRTGRVRVLRMTGGSWTRIGEDIDGEDEFDNSGSSVSLSADGSTVAINAPTNVGGGNRSGRVRVFQEVGGEWVQLGANINGVGPRNLSRGWVSLSSDGSTVAVGSVPDDLTFGGEVRVHRFDGDDWQQVGAPLGSNTPLDQLGGYGVALSDDGTILAAGSLGGHYVRVFRNVNDEWEQIGDDITSDGLGQFGLSIAMSNDGAVLAVSSPQFEHGEPGAGRVQVYRNIDDEWQQIGTDVFGEGADESFGWSLALSADGVVLAAGDPLSDDNGVEAGRVRLFRNIDDEWVEAESEIHGHQAGVRAGESVSLSADGSVLAVGTDVQDTLGRVSVYSLKGPIAFCDGLQATIVGTPGADDLVGTSNADIIAGLQGNDTIRGLGGDDIICAGQGDDVVHGGEGFDVIYGAQGDDVIYFASGSGDSWRSDSAGGRAFAGLGNDTVFGSTRWDRMQGGPGTDTLHGFEGRDWIRAGAGHDIINGGPNIDDVHGGNGNDQITIDGNDRVRGGAGAMDRCFIAADSMPQQLISCEEIQR